MTFVIHYRTLTHSGEISFSGAQESVVVAALLAGRVEGVVDKIERYDFGRDIANPTVTDITKDVAIAVANQIGRADVREISPELRDFIETHAGLEYARGLRIIDRTFSAA